MNKFKYIMMISLLAILFSCQQMEPAAPTMIDELTAYPGIGRVRLEFTPTEGAVAGKVYYNSGSVQKFWIEDGTRLQSVEVTGLPAGENTLRVVMMDAHGRESLPKGVVVEVYGESYYAGTLSNRTFIKMQDAGDDAIEITFDKGSGQEAYVVVAYSDKAGQIRTLRVEPSQTTVRVEGLDKDLPVTYYTAYKPVEDCLDEFTATTVNIQDAALMQLDKSLWIMDASSSTADGPVSNLLDGTPLTSWCAAAGDRQSFTIDMQSTKLIQGVILSQGWDLDAGSMPGRVTVEASDNGRDWVEVVSKRLAHNGFAQDLALNSKLRAQYLRFTIENPMDGRPMQLGEIDLYNDLFNTMAGDVSAMPKIVNGTVPIETDGSSDLAVAIGAGRMQRAVGWNVSDESIITADTGVGGLCIFSANAWNIYNVVNGKVWQTFELLPGYYNVEWSIGSVTDNRGLIAYGVVASGASLPDVDYVSSDERTLAAFDMRYYKSSVYNQEFELREAAAVTIGWVFTTYDLYAITGSIPWSDLYINGIAFTER